MSAIGYDCNSHPILNDFLQYENISDLFIIDETPIHSFVHACCGIHTEMSYSYVWNRLKRTLRCDLARRGSSSNNTNDENGENSNAGDGVFSSSSSSNGKNENHGRNGAKDNYSETVINYSSYRKLYQTSYSWLTSITWIIVIIIACLHIPHFGLLDMRFGLVIFFVCPFSVAMLETIYQSLYVWRVIGYWKYSTVCDDDGQ